MSAMTGDQDERRRATRRVSRKVLLTAASPVLAAIVGILTNLATSGWNWWLVVGLAAAVLVAAVLAIWLDRPSGRSASPVAREVAAPPSRTPAPAVPAMSGGHRRTLFRVRNWRRRFGSC